MAGLPSSTSCVPYKAHGFHGRAERDAVAPLEAYLLEDPRARVEAADILQHNKYRMTSALEIPGLGPCLVKWHRSRGLLDFIRTLFRGGRGEQEWASARYLGGAGAPTPRALAYGMRRTGLMGREFLYVGEFLPGMQEVAYIERQRLLAREDTLELRADVARLARRLHDLGFDHQDLHSGNLLTSVASPVEGPLTVVDLHRCAPGRTVREGPKIRALGTLLYSFLTSTRTARLRMIHAYLGGEASKDARRELFRRVERRRGRHERSRWRSRRKRCLTESTYYTADIGEGVGFRARALERERLDALLIAHDEALAASDARVAKESRKGRVTLHGDAVVKERFATGGFDRLRDRIAPGRHRAGYVNAHAVHPRGVRAARPLAFVQRGGRIFSVFRDLSKLPRLDVWMQHVAQSDNRAWRRAWLDYTADWVAWMHDKGVYHGDLKGVNVRVYVDGADLRLYLIDTDRMVLGWRPVSRRRRLKNLAQLAASITTEISRTDRLRWWRRYTRGHPLRADERKALAEFGRLVAAKRQVVREPIE